MAPGGEGVPVTLLQCQEGRAPSSGDRQHGRERAGLSGGRGGVSGSPSGSGLWVPLRTIWGTFPNHRSLAPHRRP